MCEFASIAILASIALVLVLFRKKPSSTSNILGYKSNKVPKKEKLVKVATFENESATNKVLGVVAAWADKADEHYDEDRANFMSDNILNIVCIADGLGQTHTERSDRAAEIAVESVVDFISNEKNRYLEANPSGTIDKHMSAILNRAFLHTAVIMEKELSSTYPEAKTTLIVGVETDNWIYTAYTGDGGILMTNGALSKATMILFPHHDASGDLTRFIMPGKVVGEVTISSFRKSLREGEIILIGSDGIFESDESRGYKTAYEVLTKLKALQQKNEGGLNAKSINDAFKDFIHNPIYKNLTYPDNQSLAIIITKPALEFWNKDIGLAKSDDSDNKKGDLNYEDQSHEI
ncbi:MAG: protein phosphatase 2C domain-containing protein [Anaerolineales bacterium]|nr:protein phosphatase 2C domain-containing protein [Anaerolineales bacterium]